MITPFKENGDVAYDGFVWNIDRWNNDPLAGYLVLGSSSETPRMLIAIPLPPDRFSLESHLFFS